MKKRFVAQKIIAGIYTTANFAATAALTIAAY
jgi:hypothetical protein